VEDNIKGDKKMIRRGGWGIERARGVRENGRGGRVNIAYNSLILSPDVLTVQYCT
jgi:hypothetical protein